ncbi:MAG: hypothetical protein U0Y82_09110 [Thermoleophilia bacterium]
MPVVKRSVSVAKPYALAVGMSALAAEKDVRVAVLHNGDGTRTGLVAEAVGAPVGTGRPGDLLVTALWPQDDPAAVAEVLGAHRRAGGDAVVGLVGRPAQRRVQERALLAHPDIEMSLITYLDDFGDGGRRALRDRVVRALGTRAVAAARTAPGLRADVQRVLSRRSANRAAVVGVAAGRTRAAMPVLSAMQARLAADLAGLSGGRPDAKAAGGVVGIAVSAPVWRAVARRLIRAVPSAAPLVRGGLAYTVTRGIAVLAQRLAPTPQQAPQEER